VNERTTLSDAPLYACHKRVRALKIASIVGPAANDADGTHIVRFEPLTAGAAPPVPCAIPAKWIEEKHPEVGGYLVEYEDGYRSFSPAKAFEEGYSLVGAEPGAALSVIDWINGVAGAAHECLTELKVYVDRTHANAGFNEADNQTVLEVVIDGQMYRAGAVTMKLVSKHVARTAEILSQAVFYQIEDAKQKAALVAAVSSQKGEQQTITQADVGVLKL